MFHDAFACWFLMDDFAWLGLEQEIASAANGTGWKLLFEPRAQGTMRIFSDRLYFWILSSLFGMDPLPFRAAAFAVHFLNLWLLVRIASRVTASWIPGAAAAFFFAVAASAVKPLAWASAFNQVLAACCMLAAFHLYLGWLETGGRTKWIAHFLVFLLSFGALESVIVFPAAVTLWTLLYAPGRIRGALPQWIPSFLFGAVHLFWIQHPAGTDYAPTFDSGILTGLWLYASMALSPVLAILLLAAAGWRGWRHRDWKPAFFLFWFVLFLSPVLPFQNRLTDYYLFVPSTGLALAAGCLMRDRASIAAGVVALTAFTLISARRAQPDIAQMLARSERIHRLMDAASQLIETKGVDTILLSGVDSDLFISALQDSPFRLLGPIKVFLVPGSETSIRSRADLGGVSAYKISLPQAVQVLESPKTAVLSITGDEIFDATARYRNVAVFQYLQSRPRSVNVGEPGYESLLGPGWWPIEDRFRWTSKSASVTLGGPQSPNDRLHVSGFCPESVASGGPVILTVRVNGVEAGKKTLSDVAPFSAAFALSQGAMAESVRIEVEVNRVTRLAGDKRDLGLIFGTFAIRP